MNRWQALVVAALVAAAAATFTVEQRGSDPGYSTAARLNPWLAAGQLLERRSLHVRFSPAWPGLPAHAHVIVLAAPLQMLDQAQRAALLGWVRAGGQLVATLPDNDAAARADPLATQLDVSLQQDHRKLPDAPGLPLLRLDDEGFLRAGFMPDRRLRPGRIAPLWQAEDDGGLHALRFALGKGQVTVLSDMAWMDNRRLADGDNGALLWRVVDAAPGAEAWLVYGSKPRPLLALLAENMMPLLLASLLCLLVWLWRSVQRFGPVLAADDNQRRRLSEHLQAGGRYLLAHHALALPFNASRQRLLTQAYRRFPHWRRLPGPDLARQLSLHSGLGAATIARLLATPAPESPLQFAADIRLINRLRKTL